MQPPIIEKKNSPRKKIRGIVALAAGVVLTFAFFLIVQAIAPGFLNPTFGPTDDDVKPDFIDTIRLVENTNTSCNGAGLQSVEALCPAGYKISGGGCHGGTTTWINDCQDNNARADRTGWRCSCTCSSGTSLTAQAVCVTSE